MRLIPAVLGAAATLATFAPTPAFAGSSNAAVITREGGCTGFVPTASGGIGAALISDALQVQTKSGIVTMTCHFDIPEGFEPARTTRAVGIACGTFAGFTTDARMTASPGGRALLVCRINPKKPS